MAKYTITDQEWENVMSKIRELENENQKLTGVIKGMEKALTLMEKALTLTNVSQQRELLKKWWKYFDEESVAVNCNEQEREEVINDFFNCG
tara:strand:+ start:1087 stop:1359 length:273 start_codon:yes stop_codon:yes gene_type:complete